jgi:hypothetical protein
MRYGALRFPGIRVKAQEGRHRSYLTLLLRLCQLDDKSHGMNAKLSKEHRLSTCQF